MRKLFMTAALLTVVIGGGAFAEDKAAPAASKSGKMAWTLTPDQRQNMAKMHEQMAACLGSDKTLKECHGEMRKGCEAMGKDACPMMGEHGHGKMHKGMMQHKDMKESGSQKND